MESAGAFTDGDWESLSRIFSGTEDLELVAHDLMDQCSFPSEFIYMETTLNLAPSPYSEANTTASLNDVVGVSTTDHETLFHTIDSLNSNLQYLISQESSTYSTSTTTTQENYLNYYSDSYHISRNNNISVTNNDVSMPIFVNINNGSSNYSIPEFTDNAVMGEISSTVIKEDFGDDDNIKELGHLKRPLYDVVQEPCAASSHQNPKKKQRVQKGKKNGEYSKKSQKGTACANGKDNQDQDNSNGVDQAHSSSSYSSEDDNASQENINVNGAGEASDVKALGGAVNLNGKARASRGSATDPQSLYARKRRERINERLRILQNLVPNGTKVDISTMLEEAVHYVKFLQLQIKLLSSDDLWMYAPIAYNGMDIGRLNQNISPVV